MISRSVGESVGTYLVGHMSIHSVGHLGPYLIGNLVGQLVDQ